MRREGFPTLDQAPDGVYDWMNLVAGERAMGLDDGSVLCLLTSQALVEAKHETEVLRRQQPDLDPALCANACLVRRAWTKADGHRYASGWAVIQGEAPEHIEDLARVWADFRRRTAPGLETDPERVERLKASLAALPQERLKWRVLRAFGALPTEARARQMTGRDYLWCALHLLLDREEEAARLCPACRERAGEDRCPVCGRETTPAESGADPAFDWARYEAMKRGERP